MTDSRLDTFRAMVARNPQNALARFGLANEAVKAGLLEEALEQYRAYLSMHDDEGNAYGRMAEILQRLGRPTEARDALRKGIEAARRFGHPSMAEEFEQQLDLLPD
jgi:tetratricopeptide (TPR) repeat protein